MVEEAPKVDNSVAKAPETDNNEPIFKVSKQERRMEQKMVKAISSMHESVQSRFKAL